MNAFTLFAKKLSILFRRNRFRSELDEEMAFHREQAEKDFIAAGMPPQQAHFAAMRQFGNATQPPRTEPRLCRLPMGDRRAGSAFRVASTST